MFSSSSRPTSKCSSSIIPTIAVLITSRDVLCDESFYAQEAARIRVHLDVGRVDVRYIEGGEIGLSLYETRKGGSREETSGEREQIGQKGPKPL